MHVIDTVYVKLDTRQPETSAHKGRRFHNNIPQTNVAFHRHGQNNNFTFLIINYNQMIMSILYGTVENQKNISPLYRLALFR